MTEEDRYLFARYSGNSRGRFYIFFPAEQRDSKGYIDFSGYDFPVGDLTFTKEEADRLVRRLKELTPNGQDSLLAIIRGLDGVIPPDKELADFVAGEL